MIVTLKDVIYGNSPKKIYLVDKQSEILDLKVIMAITFSSPKCNRKWCFFFLVSDESPYFSHYNLKISASIHNTLEVIAENVLISGTPIFIFLCIFITASSPVSHDCFCPREKIKSKLAVKLCKMCLWVKVN